MGTKGDFIWDNPLGVVVAFFSLMFTGFIFLFRMTQAFIMGGVFGGGILALILGFVWFKNFKD